MLDGHLENLKRYGTDKDLYQSWDCYDGPDNRRARLILEGDYRERHFVIVAHHTGNPNAYIEVKPWDSVCYDEEGHKHSDEWIAGTLFSVHRGSTYYGDAYWDQSDNRLYIGWDYGHGEDLQVGRDNRVVNDGYKWRLAEILMDVAGASYELEMANAYDPEYYDRERKMSRA